MDLSTPKLIALPFLLAALLAITACSDDPAKPGSIEVAWTLVGPTATCDGVGLNQIEAQLWRGDELRGAGTAPCEPTSKSGSILIEDVSPTSYDVIVLGYAPSGRATFEGEAAKRYSVPDGGSVTTDAIQILEKGATLMVDWILPESARCAQAGVDHVVVSLFDSQNTPLELVQPHLEPQEVGCENLFPSPDPDEVDAKGDPKLLAGVLFEDIRKIDGLIVYVQGFDIADTMIVDGAMEGIDLGAGEVKSVKVQVEAVP